MIKHFLSITDLSHDELLALIQSAARLKQELKKYGGHKTLPLLHKSMAMVFDKPSLRTRLSFEIGMTQLGGHAVYLAPDDVKLGIRETVHDSAIVISSMADCIVARVSNPNDLNELALNATVPVINAMTDQEHPCQVLADLLAIYESFGSFTNIHLAYLGDANNNITRSLALAADLLGFEMIIAAPPEYELEHSLLRRLKHVSQGADPFRAVREANVVVTDTWVSMGKEAESKARIAALAPFQVSQSLLDLAQPKAIFMHCLPAYRGKEVTAEVIDGPQSVVFTEAENRLHAQKALLIACMLK